METIEIDMVKPTYDRYELSKKEMYSYFVKSTFCLFLVGMIFYSNFLLAFLLTFLSLPLKRVYEKYKLAKLIENLRYSFRDLLYALDASISSGRQMAEALIEAEDSLNLIYGKDEPIMRELFFMKKAIKESRENEETLLKDFAYRCGIEEIISFAQTYAICRSTGANVKQVISRTTQILVDKLNISREIRTLTAQKQVEGKIISLMPMLIIVFLNLLSPEYLDKLYHTPVGVLIMSLSLGITVGAYYIMERIMDIEV